MRVFISGFGPFGDHEVNPTSLLINALKNGEITFSDELLIETVTLPVNFEESYEVFKNISDSFNPDVVIAMGLGPDREAIELELIAHNKIHAKIRDNLGEKPEHQVINPKGPLSYLSTLPLAGMEGVLKNNGVPVKISNDAGTFVCNYIFYRMMEDNQETERLCGFIHFPPLKGELNFDQQKKALQLILDYIKY
jgi:pyroglutamyl-peptidase